MKSFREISRLAAFSSMMALTIGAGSAFAALGTTTSNTSNADYTGTNNTTGPQSLNKNIWKVNKEVDVKLINKNYEKNDVDYYFNTGRNILEKNTKAGNVTGGNVTAAITLGNNSNGGLGSTGASTQTTTSSTKISGSAVDPIFTNSITGPCSENKNIAIVDVKKDVKVINDAEIKNYVDLNANTGKNDVYKNTVVGNVSSGNVNVTGTINNVANANQCLTCADALAAVNDTNAAAVASNFTNNLTGPDSVNKNILVSKEDTDLLVVNKAEIKNDIDVKANTGYNDIYKNTVVGDVSSGSVNVNFSVNNQAN